MERRGEGEIFHLTHRCHNRAFLLKFARDRDAYRAKLREHLQRFELALQDYCLTSPFLEKIKPLILSRREMEMVETAEGVYVLQQTTLRYGRDSGPKSGRKALT